MYNPQKPDKLSDNILIQRILSGNQNAFSELYERYSKPLLHYLYRMLGNNNAKAQDFLQDVFIKILKNLDRYDERQKFSTWIFTIAHNLCKNEIRRINNQKTDLIQSMDDVCFSGNSYLEPLENLQKNDFRLLINSIIKNLDHAHRSAFLLRFQDELSIKEIADILGCAEGTVKSRLHYIIKKISAIIEKKNINFIEE